MSKNLVLFVLLAASSAMGQVDWFLYRGDAQRTGAQQREQVLSTTSLDKLHLLWARQLGAQALTAPVILGRLISHHGFQELVFIANSFGDVYAIDDDLNRVLWRRHLPQNPQTCGSGLIAAPVFPPLPHNAMDSDEDNPYAPRPVYVLSGDGKLYKLSPMTGADMSAPVNFVPPNAKVSNLNYSNRTIYTTTSGACGAPAAVWSFDTKTGAIASYRVPDGTALGEAGVTIGTDGTVYVVSGNGADTIIALSAEDLKLEDSYRVPGSMQVTGTSVFQWQGRDVLAAYGTGLVLLDGKNASEVQTAAITGVAVSESSAGSSRLYASLKTGGVAAFTIENRENHPVLKRFWSSSRIASTAPVVANGVVYELSTQHDRTVFYALDASTGREIYSTGKPVDSRAGNSGLAAANGHVCFGTENGTLYCFGLPIDL